MTNSIDVSAKEVVTNYYTGEKWYLVSINGSETYVSEKKYQEMQNKGKRLKNVIDSDSKNRDGRDQF